MGTGLLQTKPAALALEKTGFEESMLKAMGKLEEELKDLKAKDTGLVEELAELKNEDAGLKEELARLESSQSRGDTALAEVPPTTRGRPDLPGIFAQHQNASERRSSCKKAQGPPLTSLVGGNISDASKLKTKKVEGVFHIVTGKKCRGTPFTNDRDASCDGFTGLSVEQCQKKCADSEKAPNCPQKTCGGAVSFESGWCHFWEECSESELVDNSAATAIIPKAGCPRGEVKLFDFQPGGATQSCCKQASPGSSDQRVAEACAGCAYFSGNSCQRCAGGFIEREGQCTACTSSGGWLSLDGKSCMQLASSECNDEKVRGQSSNEACCQCGGGVVTPTPFSYPNRRWSLDSDIVMKPEPRTALRYTVDSKCELAAHNLTIDSSTGGFWAISGALLQIVGLQVRGLGCRLQS
ncbi:unnamed protein product [Symbiodinium sp. CCMP2592]|nr:unnamed protein product [Symbiodinium sp. CCMP2592]